MLFNSSTLNTGTYYGNGYESSASGYSAGGIQRRATTSYLRNMSNVNAAGYSTKYNQVSQYLADGETKKALELMQEIEADVKKSVEETNTNVYLSDSDIQSQVENGLIASTGYTFDQAADLDGEFTHEFKKAIPFVSLFTSDCSREEALALRTGGEITDKAKTRGTLGATLGGATTGAAIGAAVALIPGVNIAAGACAIIGGLAYGAFKFIQKTAS